MRAILATAKPVLHIPVGLALSIAAMALSLIAALTSPIPPPAPDGWRSTTASAPPERSGLGDDVAEARTYLVKTAFAGGSMTILGSERSIACLHPQFALNLAAAIRAARNSGYPDAGVFSGCRPPRLGIGGFKDKRKSLHGVGLAADVHGIGAPCSARARRFHEIAAAHGVYGAYGPCNRAEFNHMQGTTIRQTTPALRSTFTKGGDIAPDLESLWRLANAVVIAAGQPVITVLDHARGGRKRVAQRHSAKGAKVAKRHRHHQRRHRVHIAHRHKRAPQPRTWERWT